MQSKGQGVGQHGGFSTHGCHCKDERLAGGYGPCLHLLHPLPQGERSHHVESRSGQPHLHQRKIQSVRTTPDHGALDGSLCRRS